MADRPGKNAELFISSTIRCNYLPLFNLNSDSMHVCTSCFSNGSRLVG
uniref:Uncharacterized protein n=1 Tax=Anguilla anguilla TaxID=7936 RepID=A0A0E9U8F5_ANGAN